MKNTKPEPEMLAKTFHKIYEKLAPSFQYKTKDESAVPWEKVPKANKELMIETARILMMLYNVTKK